MRGVGQALGAFVVAFALVLNAYGLTDYVELRVCRAAAVADHAPGNVSHVCPSHEWCKRDDVRRDAAGWMQILNLVNTLPGIVILGVAGPFSDAFGRKAPLVIGITALALSSGVYLITAHFNLPLYVLVAGSAVSGVAGNYVVVLMALFASASDLSAGSAERTTLVARVEGGLFVGLALGAVAFGQAGRFVRAGCSHDLVFATSAVLYSVGLVGVSATRETLPAGRRRPWPGWVRANPVAAVAVLCRTARLRRMAFVFALQCVVFFGYATVMQLYTTSELGFSDARFGFLGMEDRLASGAGMVFVVPAMQRWIGRGGAPAAAQDRAVLLLALAVCAAQYVAYAAVPPGSSVAFFGVAAASVVAQVQPPLIRAVISKQVTREELGTVFGAVATVEAVGQVVWPLAVLQLYKVLVASGCTAAVFALGAGVSAVSFAIACVELRRDPEPMTHKGLREHVAAGAAVNEAPEDREPLLGGGR